MINNSLLLYSRNASIISTCIEEGNETGTKVITATDFLTFKYEIQLRKYNTVIMVYSDETTEIEFLKKVKAVNQLKPHLPLILIVDKKEMNIGAKISGEKIFYLLMCPLDKILLSEIISSAIIRYEQNKLTQPTKHNFKKVQVMNHEKR